MSALVWRKEPPRVSGNYFQRSEGNKGGPVVYVVVYESGIIEVIDCFREGSSTKRGYPPEFALFQWAGPIPEPEEEEK